MCPVNQTNFHIDKMLQASNTISAVALLDTKVPLANICLALSDSSSEYDTDCRYQLSAAELFQLPSAKDLKRTARQCRLSIIHRLLPASTGNFTQFQQSSCC